MNISLIYLHFQIYTPKNYLLIAKILEQSFDFKLASTMVNYKLCLMKRCGYYIPIPNSRKKFFCDLPQVTEKMPFKLKLLNSWKLTKELSRFLKEKTSIKEPPAIDQNTPQLSLVPYRPTVHQKILDFFKINTCESCGPRQSYTSMDI